MHKVVVSVMLLGLIGCHEAQNNGPISNASSVLDCQNDGLGCQEPFACIADDVGVFSCRPVGRSPELNDESLGAAPENVGGMDAPMGPIDDAVDMMGGKDVEPSDTTEAGGISAVAEAGGMILIHHQDETDGLGGIAHNGGIELPGDLGGAGHRAAPPQGGENGMAGPPGGLDQVADPQNGGAIISMDGGESVGGLDGVGGLDSVGGLDGVGGQSDGGDMGNLAGMGGNEEEHDMSQGAGTSPGGEMAIGGGTDEMGLHGGTDGMGEMGGLPLGGGGRGPHIGGVASVDPCMDQGEAAQIDDCGVCDTDMDNNNSTCDVQPLVLYVSTNGSDQRSGGDPENAFLTLMAVQSRLEDSQPRRPVRIEIAPGIYEGQRINWRFIMPNHGIEFTRPDGATERPVFDGCTDDACAGGTWFTLRHSSGEPTRLSFNYLEVRNYQTALSFNGNRNDEDASNGQNRIFGCYFRNIGNISNPELDPSTAAVRLVNSDDNVITNNHFVHIINTRSAGLIHALYIAHMSDRNSILRNRFVDNSGDPVRIRDYSNDNVINDNRFYEAGIEAGYTDWYCDHDARDDCTKPSPECPSWNNQFRDNLLDGNYQCDPLGTFHYFQDDETTGCSPPTPDARRLRTSGNERPDPPCEAN